jgi:hypothetical protein
MAIIKDAINDMESMMRPETVKRVNKKAAKQIARIRKRNKKMTDEELLALAKIGVFALVDEATGYQKERKPGELGKIYDEANKEKSNE